MTFISVCSKNDADNICEAIQPIVIYKHRLLSPVDASSIVLAISSICINVTNPNAPTGNLRIELNGSEKKIQLPNSPIGRYNASSRAIAALPEYM